MKKIFILMLAGLLLLPIGLEASAQWFLFQNPLLGKQAPDFTLKNLSGEQRNFSALRSESPAIIFFWTTWCSHCRSQLKELHVSAEQIRNKGISLVLVDLGEDRQKVKQYIEREQIRFEILMDETGEVAGEYGVRGIPTFVYVSKDGIVKAVEHEIIRNYEEILK